MSTYHDHPLTCPHCGHEWSQQLVKGMHITRLPTVRQSIIDGTFQQFTCPSCHGGVHVDSASIYTDFERGHYLAVEHAHTTDWRTAKKRHEEVYTQVFLLGPDVANQLSGSLTHRLVFGVRALREKLIAFDHQLDDAIVECLKLDIMKRKGLNFTTDVLRLGAVLRPGGHLLFHQYPRTQAPPAYAKPVAHHPALIEQYQALKQGASSCRRQYPWVFDGWLVDATHRLVYPD